MQAPLLVRPLTDAERDAVELGLRSSNAYTLRRSQIIAASQRGEHIPRIARSLSCDEQTYEDAHPQIRAVIDNAKTGQHRTAMTLVISAPRAR